MLTCFQVKKTKQLKADLRQFTKDRNWEQFHSPKNLAMALSVEVAELVEIFQWLSEAESRGLLNEEFDNLKDEIGDVQIYLTMICDWFDLDPIEMAKAKLEKNKIKHPIDDNKFNKFI